METITEDENEGQNKECPTLENPNDEGPAGNVIAKDHQHIRKNPDQ